MQAKYLLKSKKAHQYKNSNTGAIIEFANQTGLLGSKIKLKHLSSI